jgi:hypothetical protein
VRCFGLSRASKLVYKFLRRIEKCPKNDLNCFDDGLWTFQSEYFSKKYFAWMYKKGYIVINKEFGEEVEVEEGKDEIEKVVYDMEKGFRQSFWYYKCEGKIHDKVLDCDEKIDNNFKVLSKLLEFNDEYTLMEDSFGYYYMRLLAMTGDKCKERYFGVDELDKVCEIVKEKPKGVIITYVTNDRDCWVDEVNLMRLMCCFKGVDYLKPLFAVGGDRVGFLVDWVV